MYKPIKIVLQNWLSFKGKHEFIFKNGSAVLLQGVNLADEGQQSNGSGKSSLQDAINYAIIGSSMRGVRDVDLINKEESEAQITLTLEDVKTGIILLINRKLFSKGSAKLSIVEHLNSVAKDISFASVNDGNKLILQKLGISAEDFQSYFIVSKDKYVSFFESSDTKKKDLIGRFSNANLLDDIFPHLDEKISKISTTLKEISDNKLTVQTKIDVYQEQLDNLKEVDCSDLDMAIIKQMNYINTANTERSNLAETINTHKASLIDIESNIKSLESDLKKYKGVDFSEEIKVIKKGLEGTKLSIEKFEKEIREDRQSKDEFSEMVSDLTTKLAGEIICPKCKNHFVLGEDLDLNEAKEVLEEAKSSVEELQNRINVNKNRISELTKKQSDIQNRIRDLEKKEDQSRKDKIALENSINTEKSKIIQINAKIENCHNQVLILIDNVTSYNEKIKQLKLDIEERKKNANKKEKEELNNKLEELRDEIIELEEKESKSINDKSQYERWQILFKKFRSHLANKSLSLIEGYTNMYLKKMHTNLQIKIEGFKILADGRMKENIVPMVMRNGIIEGHFRKFSGGERGRLELAVILALQNLINTASSQGLDLLVVDEVLDSVDSLGMTNMLKSANTLNKTMLLTTHVTVESSDNMVIIEKGVDEISRIKS